METKNYQHTTVLLQEAVDALLQATVGPEPVFVDGTFGRGGHSRRILSQLPPAGRLIAFDKDVEALNQRFRFYRSAAVQPAMPAPRTAST